MSIISKLQRFWRSAWLFPILLLAIVIILTSLRLHGSSVGAYYGFFHRNGSDSDLVVDQPRAVRSDEWLVTTQGIIAQSASGFPRVNPNLGNGQDMSIVSDVPYRDWSILFKPHTWPYFVLPLEYAFALKWWLLAYLLIISAYFFSLRLLPGQRLVAASLGLSLFFSPFIQWWYTYGTMGPLYYSLFASLTVMAMFESGIPWRRRFWLGIILAYLGVAFALVLYPPFQIACAVATVFFVIGWLIARYQRLEKQEFWRTVLVLTGSVVLGVTLLGAFIWTRLDVIKTINATAYPGIRAVESGDFPARHFFSSHLARQFLDVNKSNQYLIDGNGRTNQSEAANFILLAPLLLLPILIRQWRRYRTERKINWPLALISLGLVVYLFQLFYPGFTPLARYLLLDKVGTSRLLIGFGLLNFIFLVLMLRRLRAETATNRTWALIYATTVFSWLFILGELASRQFGSFIMTREAAWLSFCIATVVFLILRKQIVLALALYLVFGFVSSGSANPVYRGLGIVTDNPVSQSIRRLASTSNQRWVTDGGYLVNFAYINAVRSLSGVYNYPQLELWRPVPGAKEQDYNRYAHVGFELTDITTELTNLRLISPDSFRVSTYVCSDYLRQMDVGFAVTQAFLHAPCATIIETISTTGATIYIYRLNF